jgi:predicted RNase H-like HicB family nuclease
MVEAIKAKAKYVARFERDEDDWWVVHVDGVQGCHTQARTIQQGKERIREALSLFIGNAAYTVELEVKTVLPAPVRKAVDRSLSGRERAEAAEAEAARATELAVKAMLALGLSTRDAGELLGLSRQRVHQLASGALARNERRVG